MPWVDERSLPYEKPSQREVDEVVRLSRLNKTHARFLTDENVPADVIAIMRDDMRWTVVTADEAGLLGHPDQTYLAHARRHGMVLVTCDRDYMNGRLYPLNQIPAICVLQFGSRSRWEKLRTLRSLIIINQYPAFHDVWFRLDGGPNYCTVERRYQNGEHSRERRRWYNRRWQVWVDRDVPTTTHTSRRARKKVLKKR
jgi:hypothetical protein